MCVLKVTGKGYTPDGVVRCGQTQVRYNSHPSIFRVIEVGAVCNNSHIYDQQVTGQPTEAALLTLAMKVGSICDTDESSKKAPPSVSETDATIEMAIEDIEQIDKIENAADKPKADNFEWEGKEEVTTTQFRKKKLNTKKNTTCSSYGFGFQFSALCVYVTHVFVLIFLKQSNNFKFLLFTQCFK